MSITSSVSFALFYLLIVAWVAWITQTLRVALGTAIVCALVWLIAEWFTLGAPDTPILLWNATTRLITLLTIGIVISRLKQALDAEQALARTDFLTGALMAGAIETHGWPVTFSIGIAAMHQNRHGRGPFGTFAVSRRASGSAMLPSFRRRTPMTAEQKVDQRVFDLYDEYCHGKIDRREFIARASALTIGGISALAMAQSLFPRYAEAMTISFTDERIKATYVEYPSPGGTSGTMRGYLVQPTSAGPHPAVIVFHENRGLNPYIEDVARRAAVAGFLALAPDGLAPVGGYPGNDDDGRTLQAGLDPAKLRQDMVNSARYLQGHELSTGKLGATGFCWGGGMVNNLAVDIGADLSAGVPFYGAAAATADVPKIRAALMIQYASTDERINGMWPEFEAALKANNVDYQMYMYEGTNHGFHNNSTPRYNETAAALAWERTVAFFKDHLA